MEKPIQSLLVRLQGAAAGMIVLFALSVFFAWHGLQSVIRDVSAIRDGSAYQVGLLEPLEQGFTTLHQRVLSLALDQHQGMVLSVDQQQRLLDQLDRLDQ